MVGWLIPEYEVEKMVTSSFNLLFTIVRPREKNNGQRKRGLGFLMELEVSNAADTHPTGDFPVDFVHEGRHKLLGFKPRSFQDAKCGGGER